MAEKRTVHLTAAALSAPRPGESLSHRINAALERYGLILARAGPDLQRRIGAVDWRRLIDAAPHWKHAPAAHVLAHVRDLLGPRADGLSDVDLMLAADLAESEGPPID